MLLLLLFFSSICLSQASMFLRDTAQSHYESIVDNVLGQHNEDVLSALSLAIKDPHHLYQALLPQAQFLIDSEPMQVCVAQMPGMIANQIHEQSNSVYNRIYPLLQELWLTSDSEYFQLVSTSDNVLSDLANSLNLLNIEVAEGINRALQEFALLDRLKQTFVMCQSTFGEPVKPSDIQGGFLARYLLELTWDMESQLYSRLDKLVLSIYNDTI